MAEQGALQDTEEVRDRVKGTGKGRADGRGWSRAGLGRAGQDKVA